MAGEPNKGGVQSVERAFELLEIMARVRGALLRWGSVAARAGAPATTIHRIARTLLTMGYVRQLPNRHSSFGPQVDSSRRERSAAHWRRGRDRIWLNWWSEAGETARIWQSSTTTWLYMSLR